jgi:hypothetical protein
LVKLNDDGTPVRDSNGKVVEVYTNEDIESFARAWTVFDKTAVRGNIEEASRGSTSNRVDPMQIVADYRDAFPKSGLDGTLGDGYILCEDLPTASFLKKGAKYRLLGGTSGMILCLICCLPINTAVKTNLLDSAPELIKDPSYFSQDNLYNITRAELDPSSALYQRLFNGGDYQMTVTLENDLTCTQIECLVDTLRVVKVGVIYFEYVQPPCVQLAFYNDGKQIQLRDNYRQGQMCANPSMVTAKAACCREERY